MPIKELRVDGGMVANELLMQFQSDILGVPVVRPRVTETTALGAAYAAGLAVGYWSGLARAEAQLGRSTSAGGRRWPTASADRLYRSWRKAVTRSFDWVEFGGITVHAFMGELLGTVTLILLGNGVVACVSLKGSYGENAGWIVITTGWGLAVISGVLVALAVGSNAHLNPAVTIGVSIYSGDWSQVGAYVSGQMLGALLGAVLVYLHYFQHWAGTADPASKRACFCTSPAIRHIPSNLLSEIIGTFVLVFVAAAISSNNLSPNGLAPGFGPFLVGLLVWGIGLSLGGPTGYAINPARDLGPRIAHALLPIPGKGGSAGTTRRSPCSGRSSVPRSRDWWSAQSTSST